MGVLSGEGRGGCAEWGGEGGCAVSGVGVLSGRGGVDVLSGRGVVCLPGALCGGGAGGGVH